jgi:two-component system KDP operon response regulator KdpE
MESCLVVEDEKGLADLLKLWLGRSGYNCLVAENGRDGLRLFYENHPDLIILDLALPDLDGWQLCTRIREVSQIPLIMLTARSEETDKVRGLEMGADDYITKPFGFPELIARVQAALRRAHQVIENPARAVYQQGSLLLDSKTHRAILNGEDLKLTPTEYRLLVYLMQHSGQLLTHTAILHGVWGDTYTDNVDSLRTYIRNLRRKLEAETGSPVITTEHGWGYRFSKNLLPP